jgi:hypothetical protein
MKADVKSKLERLRAGYIEVRGQPFAHFFCPVLFVDEVVSLCQAHIINKAFRKSSRAWTVQRTDVDNFYGSAFESDFILIQYKTESWSPGRVITEADLRKQFDPRLLVDDKPVEYFLAQGSFPEDYTPIEIESSDKTVQLGLKLHPSRFVSVAGRNWEIEIDKDVRISALVSLIKAAHLTLFEMIGYRYALSAGGYFVGRQILGQFFCENHERPRAELLDLAVPFFREFANMVRPVLSCSFDIQGPISDSQLLACRGASASPWALIVFIKTSRMLHAVLIPVLDQPDAAMTFMNFLQNENDTLDVSFCKWKQGYWEIGKEVGSLVWPKKGTLYPS